MAEEKITFSVGSVFSGEGLDKGSKSVNKFAQGTARAAGIAMQMTEALGGTKTAAAKLVAPMSNVVSAFMTGGPVMAGVTGIMAAASAAMAETGRKAKEAEEMSRQFFESLKTARDLNLAAQFEGVRSAIAGVASESARSTAALNTMLQVANALDAARLGLNAATGAGGIADLHLQKINAVADQITEEGKAVVAAEFDLIEADKRLTLAKEQQTLAVDNARTRAQAADEAQKIAEDKLAAAREALATAEANAADAAHLSVEKRKAAEALAETARNALAAAENDLTVKTAAATAARMNAATVEAQQYAAVTEAEAAHASATNALAAATAERANKEAVAALQEELVFATNEQRAAAIKVLTDKLAAGATAEDAHAAAMADYDSAVAADAQAHRDRMLLAQRGHEYAAAYDAALAEGYKGQEAYNKAIADVNASTEALKSQIDENAKLLENPSEKFGEALGKSINLSGSSMKVDIDTGAMADSVNKGTDDLEREVLNWGTAEKDAHVAEEQQFLKIQPLLQAISRGDFSAGWVKALAGWYNSNGGADRMEKDMARATQNMWTSSDRKSIKSNIESFTKIMKEATTAK